MFRVTTLDLAQSRARRDEQVDYSPGLLRAGRAYLTVSGQLEAEIFACSLGKVYTFGPTFRAENSNTTRHLAEFWMVEPEMAFFELTTTWTWPRGSSSGSSATCWTQCPEDMEFFHERIDTR